MTNANQSEDINARLNDIDDRLEQLSDEHQQALRIRLSKTLIAFGNICSGKAVTVVDSDRWLLIQKCSKGFTVKDVE
ncbi:hypothetical protein WA1_51625 [Scytonema hofmannii PCC 7110]|uniref:Uncharacterized protein n=1 Tax=Scytonema hofmannii PCC 7110 TaxID=128403 RepID=A0A139WPZ2_9CYAN|nr:hypothetical protein [Scytonema hofmannii]KYC34495.1 hypothetical protein WA1_51625 [Scytonema hofmannii PCC 7110]